MCFYVNNVVYLSNHHNEWLVQPNSLGSVVDTWYIFINTYYHLYRFTSKYMLHNAQDCVYAGGVDCTSQYFWPRDMHSPHVLSNFCPIDLHAKFLLIYLGSKMHLCIIRSRHNWIRFALLTFLCNAYHSFVIFIAYSLSL